MSASHPLYKTAMRVVEGNRYSMNFGLEAIIISPLGQVKTNAVTKMQIREDYLTHYGPMIYVEFRTFARQYNHAIKIFRDSLYCVMTMVQRDASAGYNIPGGTKTSRKFRVILMGAADEAVSSKGPSDMESSHDNYVTFSAQLIELPLEKIATMQTGVVSRFSSAKDLLHALITHQAMDEVKEDNVKIKVLDIVEPDVIEPLEGMVVPHGLPLFDLAAWLQKNQKGLYNHSIGSFIRHQAWFIYPLFNLKRYGKEKHKLTIYHLPASLIPETNINWRSINGHVEVVCTDGIHFEDRAGGQQMTEGTGARFVRAENLYQDATVREGDKHILNREKAVAEINVIPRQDGMVSSSPKDYGVTDNVANVLSELSAMTGGVLKVVWRNCETNKLRPGMPSKIFYAKGNSIYSHEGVLINVEEKWENATGNYLARTMQRVAVLSFFVERGVALPEEKV